MISKRTRRILTATLLGVAFFTGFFVSNNKEITPENPPVIEQKNQIDYSEILLSELQSINKLEIYQAYLKNTVTIKQGYNCKLFKNNKSIDVYATGYYKLDLDNLKDTTVIADNSITVVPHIEYGVEVHEDKFRFTDDKGWLVFYDVEISPEEMTSIVSEVKEQMLSKMQSEEYMKLVRDKAENIIREHIEDICNYKVNIIWR